MKPQYDVQYDALQTKIELPQRYFDDGLDKAFECWVDNSIADMVKSLIGSGWTTISSCSGMSSDHKGERPDAHLVIGPKTEREFDYIFGLAKLKYHPFKVEYNGKVQRIWIGFSLTDGLLMEKWKLIFAYLMNFKF